MTCRLAEWDGAYVLGALSPGERLEYAEHLTACDSCSESVRRLAGLPGLLSRVPAEVLEDPLADQTDPEPVPETLLPTLLAQVRRATRRRTWALRALVAAAVLVVALGSVAVTRVLTDDASESPPPAATQVEPMIPVGDTSMSAEVALTGVGWGTRIDLTCSYDVGDEWSSDGGERTFAMYVHTQAGGFERVATWKPLPGRTMQLTAATAVDRDDITSVVIRTSAGRDVLELRA